ncbi:hypothetical protein FN846DRAFT_893121 [Sphaerosporella brunnea]|uniref:Secreted protein n=1 Tax=Sphaerosporella brunnea TaxID=1250544 RepID=A0A5J5EMA6_9PEZI|nr:hypothetical protein FN846DRAFT_893121 [Sphaerosporella brunnea]
MARLFLNVMFTSMVLDARQPGAPGYIMTPGSPREKREGCSLSPSIRPPAGIQYDPTIPTTFCIRPCLQRSTELCQPPLERLLQQRKLTCRGNAHTVRKSDQTKRARASAATKISYDRA